MTTTNGTNGHETPAVRHLHSATIGKIAEALAKAQGAMEHATKSGTNPAYRSSYATLADCLEALQPHLSEVKIAVVQLPTTDELGNVELITMLVHASGEWFRSDYPIRPVKHDPQGYGSAITYGRRYCLQAMTGQASADDDGNAASGRDVAARTPFPPKGNGNGAPRPNTAPVAPPDDIENDGTRVFDCLDKDGAPVSKRYHRKQLRYIHAADPSLLERLLNSPRYRDAIPPDMQQSIRGYRLRLDREEQLLKATPEDDGPTSDMAFELEEP